MQDASSSKNVLRTEVRRQLKAMSEPHRLQSSLRITEHLLEFSAWKQAKNICLFASLPSEPDTHVLMSHAWAAGKRVALPRVQHPEQGLLLHWVRSREEMQRGPMGFEEPCSDTETAGLAEIELMIIPGLAFDRQGGRMGRGGGFYDRLLARPERHALILGIFFGIQEVPRVPSESWDHPLQWIVTEEECFRVTHESLTAL